MKVIRRKRIERLADEVLERCGVDTVPVPIEAIAAKHNIQIRLSPLETDISGFLFRDRPGTVIGLNSSQAKVRQRFTVAHEVGHFLLHQEETLHVDRQGVFARLRSNRSSEGSDPEEIEANHFAASILMPARFLERDLGASRHIDSDDDEFIARLAKRYEVSSQAMLIRLINLGYVDQ